MATGDLYKEKYFKILTSNIYIYIHAQTKEIIYCQNKNNKINMNVDEVLFNHFQTLTPLQQKAVQDFMTLNYYNKNTNKLYFYQ